MEANLSSRDARVAAGAALVIFLGAVLLLPLSEQALFHAVILCVLHGVAKALLVVVHVLKLEGGCAGRAHLAAVIPRNLSSQPQFPGSRKLFPI
jgi:hypothetical protein